MSRIVFTLFLALVPFAATGHGPTVHLDADAVEPARLEIARGETVHFVNRSEATQRVLGAEDAWQSPDLPAGGAGWHLPFPFSGTFAFSLADAPEVRGEIVVKPAE
jgi:plastocyanin